MFVQINFIIAFFVYVLCLYFFPRAQNRRRNNYPSLKRIDKILNRYYEKYFFKFSSKDDFPKLNYVYDEIRHYLGEEKISESVLEVYTKNGRVSKVNFLASVCSFVLTFLGAKELDKLLDIGKKLTDLYNNVVGYRLVKEVIACIGKSWRNISHKIGYTIFHKMGYNTYDIVFWGVVVIITVSFLIFFYRAGNQNEAVKFSYNKQRAFIIKDILTSYEVNNPYTDYNIYYNIDYLDLVLTKSTKGYKMQIPKRFRTSSIKEYDFNEDLEEVSITLKKDDKEMFCTFKKAEGQWVLDTAKIGETEVPTEKMQGLKIVFEMLFEYADLVSSQNGTVGRNLEAVIEWIGGTSKLVKIIVIPILIFLIFLFSIICTILIIVLIGTGLFYLFIAGYLIWLISNWLLKNYY